MRKVTIFIYIFIMIIFTAKLITKTYFPPQGSPPSNSASQNTSANKTAIYDIYIDLVDNELFLFENRKLIRDYSIASGKVETPSPAGIWKIISKSDWGEGFGGSWMGLNVPCPNIQVGIHRQLKNYFLNGLLNL